MKYTLDSPWLALVVGVALTAALYVLAQHLVPHGVT
jgi:hypothetical protein